MGMFDLNWGWNDDAVLLLRLLRSFVISYVTLYYGHSCISPNNVATLRGSYRRC